MKRRAYNFDLAPKRTWTFPPLVLIYAFMGLCVLGNTAAQATGQGTTDPTIRLCLDEWPPYHAIVAPNNDISGVDIDVAREIAVRLNRPIAFTHLPYLRCQKSTLNGIFQGQMHVIADEAGLITGQHSVLPWALTAFVRQTAPYMTTPDLRAQTDLIWLKDSDYEYPTAIEEGFDLKPLSIRIDTEIFAQPFRILLDQTADVFFEDFFWSMNIIQENDLAIRPLFPVVVMEEVYVGFNPAEQDLARAWDDQLGRLHEEGTIDAIVTKWTGQSYQELLTSFRE